MPEEVSELLMTLRAIGPTARETNDRALRLPVGAEKGILPNLVPPLKLCGQFSELYSNFGSPFELYWVRRAFSYFKEI